MIAKRVEELLKTEGVSYEVHEHPTAYTAQEVAAAEHVSGRQVAKTVMLVAGDDLVMAVLPGDRRVDLNRMAEVLGREVRLANEREFDDVFPDCDLGAEPPFGGLYGVPVYLDQGLAADEIVFSAGDHRHTIHMARSDYIRLAQPMEVKAAQS